MFIKKLDYSDSCLFLGFASKDLQVSLMNRKEMGDELLSLEHSAYSKYPRKNGNVIRIHYSQRTAVAKSDVHVTSSPFKQE